MSGKVKFYRSSDLLGRHAVDLAYEILYLNGLDPRSKGGQAKAAKQAAKIKQRNEKICADWQAMKAAGEKRHGAAKKLAIKHGLSPDRINRILRSK